MEGKSGEIAFHSEGDAIATSTPHSSQITDLNDGGVQGGVTRSHDPDLSILYRQHRQHNHN